jgi:thiamine transport system substrate-binding protein
VVSGWEDAYFGEFSGAGEGGMRPLVVSYASSPPATVDGDADPLPDEAPIGTMLGSCFRQVEYVGELEGASEPEAARLLIDFMLSPRFQEALPLSMFVFPVVETTPLPDVFERYADVPDDPYTLAPETITAEQRQTWIEQWNDIVVR